MDRKMTLRELDNLVRIGKLKKEPGAQAEFDGLLRSGRARLADAKNTTISLGSRFDLAYNAAHALCLAALRWHGYRSENRYMVFQALPHTLELDTPVWRILATCHNRRNIAEYEGHLEVDERLLSDLVTCADTVSAVVTALGPVPGN
jgi:hypothetical protein